MKYIRNTFLLFVATILFACQKVNDIEKLDSLPTIFPDYIGTTIPNNIAPITFTAIDDKDVKQVFAEFSLNGVIQITAKGNTTNGIRIPPRKWKNLLSSAQNDSISVVVYTKGKDGSVKQYLPFYVHVAEAIDPYITYRLIKPGYELWDDMGIYQRDVTTYQEKVVVENRKQEDGTGRGCVNCHSFCEYSPDTFMFHSRMIYGGTTIITGKTSKQMNLKTEKTGNGTYPKWHPSGKYIAFSLCETAQAFHAYDEDRISVYDTKSDLMIFDVEKNEVIVDPRFVGSSRFETFPSWSPDGRWLYFSAAKEIKDLPLNNKKMLYGIYRVPFDATNGKFGAEEECIINSDSTKKSQLFPRISPDGRYLLYTECDYGTFPIWHKEAQLKMINLENQSYVNTDIINSNDVESYHSWSHDGKWIVFSSRRIDGLYTRLYISHFDEDRNFSKPFLLPQKSADFDFRRMQSYNIPEFSKGKINMSSRKIENVRRGIKTNAKLRK